MKRFLMSAVVGACLLLAQVAVALDAGPNRRIMDRVGARAGASDELAGGSLLPALVTATVLAAIGAGILSSDDGPESC